MEWNIIKLYGYKPDLMHILITHFVEIYEAKTQKLACGIFAGDDHLVVYKPKIND